MARKSLFFKNLAHRPGGAVSEALNEKTRVIIVTTGGTIDKTYDELDGSLENKESAIKESIIKRLRLPYTELEVLSVLNKDSLYMTDFDRALLVKSLRLQLEKGSPIVVLHGTDTMAKSAQTVLKELGTPPVPIVFTGAMKPLGFDDSDAKQNVTEALLASKLLAPGVYICFHNRVFPLPNVRKNKDKRTFEATSADA